MKLIETHPQSPVASDQPVRLPAGDLGQLHIQGWPDVVIDQVGHDPRSDYVERFWLAILGPSTTLLLRRLATLLDERPDGLDLDLTRTALAMGLGAREGRNAPFARALRRSCTFGLARYEGPDTLAVRRRVPPLNLRQVGRLPQALQDEHAAWLARDASPSDDLRQRARRLALGLVQAGDDLETTERQLHRWRFHPALAFDAARWAWEHEHGPDLPPAS